MVDLQLKVWGNPAGLNRGDVRSDYFDFRVVVRKVAGGMLVLNNPFI